MWACGLGPDNQKLISRFMILIEAKLQRCSLDSLEIIPSKSDIESSVSMVSGAVSCADCFLACLPHSGHFLNTVSVCQLHVPGHCLQPIGGKLGSYIRHSCFPWVTIQTGGRSSSYRYSEFQNSAF